MSIFLYYRSIVGSRTPSPMGSSNQSLKSSLNRNGHESSRNCDVSESSRIRQERELCSGREPAKALSLKKINEDMMEKKAKDILEEYLSIQDLDKAVTCVKELESPSTIYMFVYTCFAEVIEKSANHRRMTGGLLYELVARNVLSLDVYYKGSVALHTVYSWYIVVDGVHGMVPWNKTSMWYIGQLPWAKIMFLISVVCEQ